VNKEIEKTAKKFIIPSFLLGIGGWAKPIFLYLYFLYWRYFDSIPDKVRFSIYDFDEASARISFNGIVFSNESYLISLPKKPLKDVIRKIKNETKNGNLFTETFKGFVDLDSLVYFDMPGLNLRPQLGNLGWRLVWESHVLEDLKNKVQHIHVTPRDSDELEKKGIQSSRRSLIWVVAGIASTTGPTGLIPLLSQISSLKPPEANVFVLLITPRAYRDKSAQHRERGRAICLATMETLCRVAEDMNFDQPYGLSGYRIKQTDKLFDLCFLVDGTFSNGRSTLEADDLARLIAYFIFRTTTTPLGEELLRIAGNLNTKEATK
jgi:hypothetical protein